MTANTLYSDFIDAADIDGNIKNDKLVLDTVSNLASGIIRYDLYNELKDGAVYGFFTNNWNTQKLNFVNPSDDNSAFRLTKQGTIISTYNAINGNGTNGIINTRYSPNTVDEDDSLVLIYSRSETDPHSTPVELGCRDIDGSGMTTRSKIYFFKKK